MIDKALIAIQSTGLFEIAVLEWNGFDAMNQTWPEFKEHFAEAYDSRLASGAGTASQSGYHNAYNAVDDDSIGTRWISRKTRIEVLLTCDDLDFFTCRIGNTFCLNIRHPTSQ